MRRYAHVQNRQKLPEDVRSLHGLMRELAEEISEEVTYEVIWEPARLSRHQIVRKKFRNKADRTACSSS